jgi:hypothetical protein
MMLSAEQIFSDSQALTVTAASTNIIDLGATGTVLGAPVALTRDIGPGKPVEFIVQLDVDSGGTTPTLDVEVQVDTVENFASPTTVASSEQLAGGSAGDRVQLNCTLPEGTNQRYLRLNYTLGGTSPTYTVTAGIVAADQTNVVPGA